MTVPPSREVWTAEMFALTAELTGTRGHMECHLGVLRRFAAFLSQRPPSVDAVELAPVLTAVERYTAKLTANVRAEADRQQGIS